MTEQTPHPDDLLTAKECCRLLKISRRTFCRLREEGRLPLPTIQTSRTTMRWRRGDLVAAMEPTTCPDPATTRGRIAAASTYARAAAISAHAAALHADNAAAKLRNLAAELINPAALAEGAD